MQRAPFFEWEGFEYEHNPKTADWYWALGILSVAATLAALLFAQYLLAVLIIVAATSIALYATRKPPLHRFGLDDNGLYIGEEFHPFERMTSFSVLEDIEGELPPLLSIHTDLWFTPHLEIPLEDVDADGVYAHMLTHVEEKEHRPTLVHLIEAWLGF